MTKQTGLLNKTRVIGIIFLFILMGIIPSVAVDTVNIEHTNGKSSSDDIDWWPIFRHDLQHSGYSTSDAPDTNNVLWEYYIGEVVHSSPAVADGKVYIGSGDGNVYCLNAISGDYIWSYKTGDRVGSSPAIADGKVYIGSGDGNVYCLNAISGDYIWSYKTGFVESSPAIADSKLYIGSNSGNVYCLNAISGDYIWSYKTGRCVYSSPTVLDGKVYIGSDDGNVYCLNAISGDYIWSYKTGDRVGSSPAIADGKVYIGSSDYNVYCLDVITGDYIWSYKIGNPMGYPLFSSPAVADGKVFFSRGDNVYCLDANTGDYIWSYKTGTWPFSVYSSPAVGDGKVYTSSEDDTFYAFGELDPDTPSIPEIDGPAKGLPDVLYNFTFKSESPLDNDLFYWIEWADGSNSGWLGPFDSGIEITESHIWDTKGVYPVQAKAKDTNGLVSGWGVLGVTIPRNKVTINSWFLWFLERFPILSRLLYLIK